MLAMFSASWGRVIAVDEAVGTNGFYESRGCRYKQKKKRGRQGGRKWRNPSLGDVLV